MQVMKQWCTQKHSFKAQIYSRMIWEGLAYETMKFGAFL